jgi:hypothetical protein
MVSRVRVAVLAALCLALASLAPAAEPTSLPPRLIVLFSIDQCRADYLTRFGEFYLPERSDGGVGGFRFLIATGAHYRDAHFGHVPTFTGPGHATLLTGSAPALDGIVANRWYDRDAGAVRYCVNDESVEVVGGNGKGMSPRSLLVTTVGDELKLATGGAARVVGIAYKDRAAILMAGHAANLVLWLDDSSGRWVSSTFYTRGAPLPGWVKDLNEEKLIARYAGKTWTPLLRPAAYAHTLPAPGQTPAVDGTPFAHALGGERGMDRTFVRAFTASGFGNEVVFETAKLAVENEQLGRDDVPDLLVVNLSSNDYVGHAYGPDSPEVMDVSVRTDRALADFLNYLAAKVPGGLERVLVVVTGDHGVAPVPEEVTTFAHARAGRISNQQVIDAVTGALNRAFGDAEWVLCFDDTDPNLYLNRRVIEEKRLQAAEVERVAAQAAAQVEGVYTTLTRTQFLDGRLPGWEWVRLAVNGFHPRLSGDIMVYPAPNWIIGMASGTTHGSAWAYDTHVPLVLRGAGITPGRFLRRVTTMDIAPTLSQILGIGYPSGCMGRPLVEALGSH